MPRGSEWRRRVRALAASGALSNDAARAMGMTPTAFSKASCREFGCTWVELKREETARAARASDLVAAGEERTREFRKGMWR